MSIFYLDTSALLKRYKSEVGSALVADLFATKASHEVFTTSYFTILEGTSVARRLLKGRLLRRRAYMALMARFLSDSVNLLVLQSVNDDAIGRAIRLVEQFALRPGDAVQLATAQIVKDTIPGERLIFLASDLELYRASASSGIESINPEDPGADALMKAARAAP
jgi:predicted nucleic acid-binding protein